MKSRPILFNAEMVRAVLDGSKTQTRRIMKPQFGREPVDVVDGVPSWDCPTNYDGEVQMNTQHGKPCPFGKPGDQLWVRENFSGPYYQSKSPPKEWSDDDPIWYWADGNPETGDWTKPKPSIHMPRWASRITLEITSVRVERLQDISEVDAMVEGLRTVTFGIQTEYGGVEPHPAAGHYRWYRDPVTAYRHLWESINGAGSWAANPWVWVVEFKRIEQE